MSNHIESAALNIQGGLLTGTIKFRAGLNFICGENGTLKTKVLQFLKNGTVNFADPHEPCKRQAISPRRNAQRRAINQVLEHIRRENIQLDKLTSERNINDTNFEDYPSLGDLFYVVYGDLAKAAVEEQFNGVIKQIFPSYELKATWDARTGNPALDLSKGARARVPLEGLSLGEQEILSLAVSIFASRERYDVFLIDEPEVHLNWHLEERLFEYLDGICETYQKQMIIVTHSRAVFKERFLKKTQFLFWKDDGTVGFGAEISPEQRRRIAGDAIDIIRLGAFTKATFFVEDRDHVIFIEELASLLKRDVVISDCGNKANVRSLYRYALLDGGWDGCVFVEDGDNEGSPYPSAPTFVHLDRYCIQNYLIDPTTLAAVMESDEPAARKMLLDAIVANRSKIFKKNQFFEFLVDSLKPEDLNSDRLAKLDAAAIIEPILNWLGLSYRDFVQRALAFMQSGGSLQTVLPSQLIELMSPQATPVLVDDASEPTQSILPETSA